MSYLGRKGQTAALASADLPTNSITTSHIVANAVTSAKIGVDVIVAEDIANNAITVAEIADDAVTADKLANSINTDIATGVTANTTANAALPKAGGTMTGNIVMGDDTSIGIADDAERIEFDGAGDISLLGCNVGIGTTAPNEKLHIKDGKIRLHQTTGNDGGTGITFGEGSLTDESFKLSYDGSGSGTANKLKWFALNFDSGNTPFMTFLRDGSIYTGDYPSGKGVWAEPVTNGVQTFRKCNTASTFYHFFFQNSNGTVGNITTNGSSTTYTTSSDYRLKENVVPMSGSIDRIKQLNPSRFNFIADADVVMDGFLAHEVSNIVSEAITGEKDAMTEAVLYVEGDELPEGKSIGDVKTASVPDMQGIDQSKLVPLLVGALQEAIARIETLESA